MYANSLSQMKIGYVPYRKVICGIRNIYLLFILVFYRRNLIFFKFLFILRVYVCEMLNINFFTFYSFKYILLNSKNYLKNY